MKETQPGIPLILFAKVPIPGKVKTRFLPHCSGVQAAEIAKILLEQAIRRAVAAWPGPILLSVWPGPQDDFIQRLGRAYPVKLVAQIEGDLGEKMFAAFECYGYPAAILGCDAPHVQPAVLRQAYSLLAGGNNILAGSNDGGYYLIGMATSCRALFQGVAWGTAQVFKTTIDLARQNLLEFEQLTTLNDIDDWQDVLETAAQLPELQRYLLKTGLSITP